MNWKYLLFPFLLPLIVVACATGISGLAIYAADQLVGKVFLWILE